MKVVIASFQYEACGKSEILPKREDFEYEEGNDIFKKLEIQDIFSNNNVDVVPVLYANALPGGVCPLALYETFAQKIIDAVEKNKDADAILLVCHGSSEIESIGSGELNLVQRIRQIVGENPLIAISFDLHANIDERLIKLVNIVCGYKTAPHTDQTQTHRACAAILVRSLKEGLRPVVCIKKVPMLLTGDMMLTGEEPLKTLIGETGKAESGEILRVNLFFSHMWVDAPNTCASVTVTATDKESGEKVANSFANKFWQTRDKYKFRVQTGSVSECVDKALKDLCGRIFLSDSGDNTTAGAEGNRTQILEEFLKKTPLSKKVCIAGITSEELVKKTQRKQAGDTINICLSGILREGRILRYGKILGWAKNIIGDSVSLDINGITVIFTDKRSAFISEENFKCANENLKEYEIVIVKLGYLFSELLPFCKKHYFVLSDGASCVDIFKLNLQKIPRPMYPLDKFDWKI